MTNLDGRAAVYVRQRQRGYVTPFEESDGSTLRMKKFKESKTTKLVQHHPAISPLNSSV